MDYEDQRQVEGTETHLLNCCEEIHLYILKQGTTYTRHACPQLVERQLCKREVAGSSRGYRKDFFSRNSFKGKNRR